MAVENANANASGLPPAFKELESRLGALNEQYRRGQLTDAAYQTAVQALTLQDAAGVTWWLGGEPGLWHRWDGRQWVRDHPSVHRAAPVVAPTQTTKSRRPLLMGCGMGVLIIAIVTAVLLIGGWQEYKQMPKIIEGLEPAGVVAPGYTMTPVQMDVFGEMGPPQAFTILFYEEELLNGSFGDVRLETWDYYDRAVSITFINGELVGEDPIEVEIAGEIYPIPYRPEQFTAYMSLDEILGSAGLDRFMVVPLEKELVEGGEIYYADELTFGLKDDELRYIEALALEVTE